MNLNFLLQFFLTISYTFATVQTLWSDFKTKYGKTFKYTENKMKRETFVEYLVYIEEHNKNYSDKNSDYLLQMNSFGDLTLEEAAAKLNGFDGRRNRGGKNQLDFVASENVLIPDSADWREKGFITPVKEQDACANCWAFSAVDAIEGRLFKLKNLTLSLSAQQLVDCSQKYKNKGCRGGSMDYAFKYVQEVGGLANTIMYPNHGQKGTECHVPPLEPEEMSHLSRYRTIQPGDERSLLTAVAYYGPVSAALSANTKDFLFYKEGIFPGSSCGSKIDHAILIMGYTPEYWIIKNSWGEEWGEDGYMKLGRKEGDICGITSYASFPFQFVEQNFSF